MSTQDQFYPRWGVTKHGHKKIFQNHIEHSAESGIEHGEDGQPIAPPEAPEPEPAPEAAPEPESIPEPALGKAAPTFEITQSSLTEVFRNTKAKRG